METEELFPYQKEGVEFLSSKRWALLAHEMGLGKTVMAIRGLDRIHAKNAVVVCPSVARTNWKREISKWSLSGVKPVVLEKLSDVPDPAKINICSYDYALENYRKLTEFEWDALVLDEVHFLKSHTTKRARAIVGKDGVIRKAKRCWMISGTPAPNHPGELWVMLYTFGLTKLSYQEFVGRYCISRKTSYGIQISGANLQTLPELKETLKTFMLRRMKKDVMRELPPIVFGDLVVQPGPVDVEICTSFAHYFFPVDKRKELFNEIKRQAELLDVVYYNAKGDEPARIKLNAVSGIQQSISTLRKFVGLQKVEPVCETLEWELENYEYRKIVVFAIHTDVIKRVVKRLEKYKPLMLFGQTTPEIRQKNIDLFQHDENHRVFVANIMAAGTAINLTRAHHVVFIEQDWVPGNNAQAIMRCHRIGQENTVSVRFAMVENTLDEHIARIVKRKTKELTLLFD